MTILDENFAEEENNIPTLTDKEVFTHIWTKPRMVYKYIVHYEYAGYFTLLLVLAGIANNLDSNNSQGQINDPITSLILKIVLGAFLGWIGYYIYGFFIKLTGKLLGGKAATINIVQVLVYASLPSILSIIPFILLITIFGIRPILEGFTPGNLVENVFYYGAAIINLLLGIYMIVLSTIGLSVLQKFSNGRAFLNLVLPALILVGIAATLVIGFDGLGAFDLL